MNSWASLDIPALSSDITFPPLRLFDAQHRSIITVDSKPIYRMYVCGITPYDATHLGHAATYVTFDIINRYLRATGSEVRFVQNITDIDDPLLERATRDNQDWRELAQSQIELFRGDMVDLHVLPPDHYVGVVEAMPLVTQSIQRLHDHGATYLVEEDLYFSVHADKEFGERSHLSRDEMEKIFAERGGDPARAGKKDSLDALLWLAHREGEPEWPSPFGSGRPGWHIECCAIALEHLHPSEDDSTLIDIQGGGSDLIFPHHEMSAAQASVMYGKPFASHYVHAGMIGLDGEKMSKSKGNLVFVSRLIRDGVDPMVIRWALLNRNYREDFMWTDDVLKTAEQDVATVRRALSLIECSTTDSVIQEMADALANNIDSKSALTAVLNWSKSAHLDGSHRPGALSRALDSLLGLAL